jgi:uncharacterized iron-regulated membrane protein
MSDEPTPDAQAPTAAADEAATDAPATIDATTDEPATIDATTDDPTTDQATTDESATDEAATLELVPAVAKAPPPRSIARDLALVAVVFVAVFILLAGLLWLAAPSGERGATSASPISTPHSVVDPTLVGTAL